MAECGRIVSIALVGMAVASDVRAEPPAQRQDELLYRLRQDCGSDQEIGVAPGPRLEVTPYRKQRRAAAVAS
jgi:hypothetical protein